MMLSKAKWFIKLDLPGAYNLVLIANRMEWKTAFRSCCGHYEYMVMPFSLTNTPASFPHLINDILREYLDVFCTAYIDDILIYSDTLEEHRHHVRTVLQSLEEAGQYLKPEKCEFQVQQTKYLGLIILSEGMSMDPATVATVKEWPSLEVVKGVQTFLGFANFYRRFIQGFSELVSPLTTLTKKGIKCQGTPMPRPRFNASKDSFTPPSS